MGDRMLIRGLSPKIQPGMKADLTVPPSDFVMEVGSHSLGEPFLLRFGDEEFREISRCEARTLANLILLLLEKTAP